MAHRVPVEYFHKVMAKIMIDKRSWEIFSNNDDKDNISWEIVTEERERENVNSRDKRKGVQEKDNKIKCRKYQLE